MFLQQACNNRAAFFAASVAWVSFSGSHCFLCRYRSGRCSFPLFSCGCAYLNDMKVKLQDLFLGLAALTAQLRALLSSAFLQHRVPRESVWVKALVYHFVNHAILVTSKPLLQCMALMMLAAARMTHMEVVRILAGCKRKSQRLDKTVRREFSFAHATHIPTAAPIGAILRASPQIVLSFRVPFFRVGVQSGEG